MADVLDELPEWARGGRREKYPYDRWFDGQVWLLHEGVDFEQDRRGMANRIRHAAKKRGLRVTVSHRDEDGRGEIVVQKRTAVFAEVA
jgi:hypothetical protein